MKFVNLLTTRRVVLGCLCTGALATVACGGVAGGPTGPSASTVVAVVTSLPRSGELHVTKECSVYTGLAGSFCTITSSNLKEIEVGSTVVYATDASPTTVDSDVVLAPPGPGNNAAFGHCTLDRVTRLGRCTFSGGTGAFTGFNATVDVSSPLGRPTFAWDGTYSFSTRN